jgi:hypothetical protein
MTIFVDTQYFRKCDFDQRNSYIPARFVPVLIMIFLKECHFESLEIIQSNVKKVMKGFSENDFQKCGDGGDGMRMQS